MLGTFFRIRDYPVIDNSTHLPISSNSTAWKPIWGEVTSTIDWCEENYVQSGFIAEFCNTLSNMSYIFVSLFLYYRLTYKLNIVETRFKLTMAGLLLVGLGSAMFHMSLRYDCQLLDELPMIYITCIPCYSVLCEPLFYEKEGAKKEEAEDAAEDGETDEEEETEQEEETEEADTDDDEDEDQALLHSSSPPVPTISKAYERSIITTLTLLSLIVTFSYIFYITNPVFHEICYGILNVIIVFISTTLTIKYIHDKEIKHNLMKSSFAGICLFLFGFILWGLDRQYCGSLIYIRREYLKLPLGNILELHAYWHLFTGIGLYYMLNFLIFLRINLHNTLKGDVYYNTSYSMDWVLFGLVPLLRKND